MSVVNRLWSNEDPPTHPPTHPQPPSAASARRSGGERLEHSAKLTLVDLAGSERQAATGEGLSRWTCPRGLELGGARGGEGDWVGEGVGLRPAGRGGGVRVRWGGGGRIGLGRGLGWPGRRGVGWTRLVDCFFSVSVQCFTIFVLALKGTGVLCKRSRLFGLLVKRIPAFFCVSEV